MVKVTVYFIELQNVFLFLDHLFNKKICRWAVGHTSDLFSMQIDFLYFFSFFPSLLHLLHQIICKTIQTHIFNVMNTPREKDKIFCSGNLQESHLSYEAFSIFLEGKGFTVIQMEWFDEWNEWMVKKIKYKKVRIFLTEKKFITKR